MFPQSRLEQDIVLLAVGGGDVADGKATGELVGAYTQLVKSLKEEFGCAKIVVSSVLPKRDSIDSVINCLIKKFNDALYEALSDDVKYVDTWDRFVDRQGVVDELFQTEENEPEDDTHISEAGKGVLGGMWRLAISQALKHG